MLPSKSHHLSGIIYRDLKLENILLQIDGHVYRVTLIYHSELSVIKHPKLKRRKSRSQPPPTFFAEPSTQSNSFVGTEEYISPEVITGAGHSSAIDWWAVVPASSLFALELLSTNPKTLPPPFSLGRARVQKSSLAAEHAVAKNFDTAIRLLNRQLGIKNFTLLKSLFLDLHMGSDAFLRAFSSSPLISLAIERGWSESASPNVWAPPALVFNFSQLEEKLKAS
ncbi:coatomer subunit alpha-3-like [Lactuca sativa]|uniref:coatomer subunit alpha-3-like n=1 Tax=Lactuca sativa TaxID=4236 RepID=UPI0022B03591|nr:coatomer subunit alpha-3-like [Lactuca sativa]